MSKPSKAAIEAWRKARDKYNQLCAIGPGESEKNIDPDEICAAIIDEAAKGLVEALKAIHKESFEYKASDLIIAIENNNKAEAEKIFDKCNEIISNGWYRAETALADWRTE